MYIHKRNGEEVVFDPRKIEAAITKANDATEVTAQISKAGIKYVTETVCEWADSLTMTPTVDDIGNYIQSTLMKMGGYQVATNFITYRYKRQLVRKSNSTDEQIMSLIERSNEDVKQENANKNPTVNSVQRDYMAGEVSKDITRRFLLPEDVVKAHEEGIIHFHDADYFAQHMHNCCLVNLEDMLMNGTVISETMIERPKSFSTACNIATQAIAQIASSQYGGQSITLSHLVPFVDISRQKFRKEVREELIGEGLACDDATVNSIAEKRLGKEVEKGCQVIQYQVITLMTTNGQAPFITVYMYLDEVEDGQAREDLALIIEEMLKQRILGVKNEKGVYVAPAFPKLIYVLDEDNIREDSKYWYLTELAARCTSKRLVPDYISAKKMKELKGDVYPCMGCRSFLTPDNDAAPEGLCNADNKAGALNYQPNSHKYYGRFNQGVVTLNLVDVACSSQKDMDEFWRLMDERTELCKKALMCRHERLLGTPSDVAPILWQNGALARLEKGETIDRLLFGNYSTISLGYAGLYECTRYMTGASHTGEGKEFALSVMRYLNDKCAKWRAETNIAFSIYGTPLESTTYKFAKALQKRFGKIEGVTDRNYITNSYHVHVTEEIDAFTKLKFESEFQALSPGGAISYVEVPDLSDNIEAVLSIMKYIYDNIMYAELNTKSDYCQCCGYDKEILIVEDENKKLIWECPNCKNRDTQKMNIARRTCGYIGTQGFNAGRTAEIADRRLHIATNARSIA
ncbi:anaerobic ribonucleoside-triphosphate reductase [Butyrivibrio proteoclasticus]|uniref:anaerobic ribonucleoside-triphosphate reductase n=1 Tax=Butyrivibrio proteoclasticus TaxID=43305 RepID=UPI00047D3B3F|nr:anaerobic ribonucleoside-triphosphate reductase [Butyrivibrio proteoclasticus]